MDARAIVETGYEQTFNRLCACGQVYAASDRDAERVGMQRSLQCPRCRWAPYMLDLGITKIGFPFADALTLRPKRCIWFRDGQTVHVAVEPGTTTL